MIKILCTEIIDPNLDARDLEAYLACRLIPLNKCPGVRPIGIGEILRRIFGKVIIGVIRPDIINRAGSLELCAGQKAGCEASVHAMTTIFKEEETDAIFLVDASNAFNALNRKVLLHNISYLCPPMATYVLNCYQMSSRLFVFGGKEIASDEGTTQGDPMAMPICAIGIAPLLTMIKDDGNTSSRVRHVAFADDLAGGGSLKELRYWWENVNKYGPLLGYNPKASKSWIIVKNEKYDDAINEFQNTNINITTEGHKYLGGVIGINGYNEAYANNLVNDWVKQIMVLSEIYQNHKLHTLLLQLDLSTNSLMI